MESEPSVSRNGRQELRWFRDRMEEEHPGFKKSAESDTTRPSRNRLGPNRVDTDTGYVGMLGIGGTRYKSVILGQLGRVSRDDSATRQKTKKSNLCFLLNQKNLEKSPLRDSLKSKNP